MSDSTEISFPESFENMSAPSEENEVMTLQDMERHYVEKILGMTHWKVAGRGGAASVLGMKPTTLFSRMKKLGIRRL